MDEKELLTAANALAYQLSKISGCFLPTHNDAERQKEKQQDLFRMIGKFLQNNRRFKWLTTAEAALAAVLNSAGELANRVKHWQGELNLDYLGELLDEYCRYKQRLGLREKLERESTKFLPAATNEDPFFWPKHIEYTYQQFLSGKYSLHLWPHEMYNHLVEQEMIPANLFVRFLQPAFTRIDEELRMEYESIRETGGNLNYVLEKINYISEYKHSNRYVLFLAKRLAVREYFKVSQKKGFLTLIKKIQDEL